MGLGEDFLVLTRKKYEDQAKWFLNGFWKSVGEKESENIWNYTQKFIELDTRKADGNELDEFWSHKFLETFDETLTVVALREQLKKIDLDVNGKMALLEYLCFKFDKTVKQCVDAPQGGNEELINAAQAKLNEVQTALAAQQKALDEQKVQEAKVKQAEAELKDAIAELKAQEEAYTTKVKTLEAKANDTNAAVVAKNKAAAELAQLKAEDPLPLRKAKITQEAALRRVEKERKAAEAATANLEKKVDELLKVFAEAEAKLKELQQAGGSSQGSIWFMTRQLKEAQKYLPKRKQRTDL